jgi:hypothetical protein
MRESQFAIDRKMELVADLERNEAAAAALAQRYAARMEELEAAAAAREDEVGQLRASLAEAGGVARAHECGGLLARFLRSLAQGCGVERERCRLRAGAALASPHAAAQ